MKYDVNEIKELLTKDIVFELVNKWGGNPRETSFGFVSKTICHNPRGEGKYKLYYYHNTKLFKCYTGCEEEGSFDIFDLYHKVKKIQDDLDLSQYDCIKIIGEYLNYTPNPSDYSHREVNDLLIIKECIDLQELEYSKIQEIKLPVYDDKILDHLTYPIIYPWEQEGISREVLKEARIGYFPADEQITIPHYDIDNNFIGLRGRSLCDDDIKLKGKYRPIIANQMIYRHPLGFNLYNLNNVQENIKKSRQAVVYEGEKSVLKYRTLVGSNNDISVACCGFNITSYQIHLLQEAGANEIILAFDRQFKNIGDNEYYSLLKKFKLLSLKYNKYVKLSFIFDRYKTLSYKSSPIDEGLDKFLKLYQKRIQGEKIC